MPSSHAALRKREFNHLELMYRGLGLPILDPLEKVDGTEQKKLDHLERLNHRDFVRFKSGAQLTAKNILLVDDVISTGSSINAAVKVLREDRRCRIRVLSLMYNDENS